LEDICDSIEDKEKREELQHKMANILTNFTYKQNNITSNAHIKHLNHLYQETKSFLKEAKDNGAELVVIDADKGNKTVIMEKEQYESIVEDIIEDRTTYQKLRHDPTEEFQQKVNKFVDEMIKRGYIEEKLKWQLKWNNAIPPRLYAKPKIHKLDENWDIETVTENLKGRPVVSSIGSPTYNLSKYISEILTSSFVSKYNIKNSYELLHKLRDLIIPEDYILISLDVCSLFSCVSINLIIESIKKRWDDIKQKTKIDQKMMIEAIKIIHGTSYFKAKGKFLLQKFGTTMGGSSSSISVDMVMEDLLDSVIDELGYDPLICVKYVDDLFLVVPMEEAENTLTMFNNYNKDIKFTMELEDCGKIAYLDMEIIRMENGQLKTKWYSKPMSSNRLLDYNSNHTISQKLNVAKGLIKRVCDLTTIKQPRENWEEIFKILKQNNYPTPLIRKLFQQHIYKKQQIVTNNTPAIETVKERTKYRSLPNIRGLTEKISQCVKSFDKNIQICPRNTKTVKSLYSMVKDKIPLLQQSKLIYSINCAICELEYLGMTFRQYLETRQEQHQDDIKTIDKLTRKYRIECEPNMINEIELKIEVEKDKQNTNKTKTESSKSKDLKKLLKQCRKSGITTHYSETGHKIDFQNIKIVDRENNKRKLEILETLHIKSSDNMNKKEDNNKIKNTYNGILHKIKKRKKSRFAPPKN
jgi:hypothetical protein